MYPSVPLHTVPILVNDSEHVPLVMQQMWGPHSLAPSLFEANMLAEEKKKRVDLDASESDVAQLRSVFDKSVKETLRNAIGKSKAKPRDSLATLLEEWAGAKGPSHSTRFARAVAFGQDKDDGLTALDSELSREERLKIAENERQERLRREDEERQQMLADMQEELNELSNLGESLAAGTRSQTTSVRALKLLAYAVLSY
jgi:hypothetical protein